MKVFVSWSGPRSNALAILIQQWLRRVIQAVDPWISSDIDKGARWSDEVAAQLGASHVGIICLTTDNLGAPWIHFEAGALAKTSEARVCVLLLDVHPNDVPPTLAQFQHTLVNEQDLFKLAQTVNHVVRLRGERALDDAGLRQAFADQWPSLRDALGDLCHASSLAATTKKFPIGGDRPFMRGRSPKFHQQHSIVFTALLGNVSTSSATP